jgi:hypothetical protein
MSGFFYALAAGNPQRALAADDQFCRTADPAVSL